MPLPESLSVNSHSTIRFFPHNALRRGMPSGASKTTSIVSLGCQSRLPHKERQSPSLSRINRRISYPSNQSSHACETTYSLPSGATPCAMMPSWKGPAERNQTKSQTRAQMPPIAAIAIKRTAPRFPECLLRTPQYPRAMDGTARPAVKRHSVPNAQGKEKGSFRKHHAKKVARLATTTIVKPVRMA